MTRAFTTDDKGFSPLAAVAMSTEKIETLRIPASEFKVDAIFVMSPKTALEIQKLSRKKAGGLVEAKELHMPYDSLIVEMPITPEIAILRNAVEGENNMSIRRVAARIRRTEVSGQPAFEFWPFWEFDNGTLGCGAFMANIFTDQQTATTQYAFSPSPMAYAINSHILSQANTATSYAKQFAVNLLRMAPKLKQEVIEEVSPLMFIWESVINCKSGIARTKIGPRQGVGTMLGRRKKIMASTEYTVVSLSAVETVCKGTTSQRADVEAHLVRGHFKRRSSGVYWWSPFIRGTGELKQRKAYIVEGALA